MDEVTISDEQAGRPRAGAALVIAVALAVAVVAAVRVAVHAADDVYGIPPWPSASRSASWG